MSYYTSLDDNNSKHLPELKKQVNALKITKNTSVKSIELLRGILDKQIQFGAEDANIALTKSKLGEAHSYTNLEDAIKYLKEAHDFYRDTNDHKSMINLSFDIGNAYLDIYHQIKNKNNIKKQILQKALAYFTEFDASKIDKHPNDIVLILDRIATTLYYLGRYNEAFVTYHEVIKWHTYYSGLDFKYSLSETFIDEAKKQYIVTLPLLYKPKNNDTSLNKEFYIRALVIKGDLEFADDKFNFAYTSYTTAKSLIEDKNYYNKNMTHITKFFRQELYNRIIKVNEIIKNERHGFNSINSTNDQVLAEINNANWPTIANANTIVNNAFLNMGGSRKYTRKDKNRRHGRTQRK